MFATTLTALTILASLEMPHAAAPHYFMSGEERRAAVQPYVTKATSCVEQVVAKDNRATDTINLGDAIVDAMPQCADLMQAMIATYDWYFGDGAGEAFFSGPYLDVLPTAIIRFVDSQRKTGPPP